MDYITIRENILLKWFSDNQISREKKSPYLVIDEHYIPISAHSFERTKLRLINSRVSIDMDLANKSDCKDIFFTFMKEKKNDEFVIDMGCTTLTNDMKKLVGEICATFDVKDPKCLYAGGKKFRLGEEYIYICKTKNETVAFNNSADALNYLQEGGCVKKIRLM